MLLKGHVLNAKTKAYIPNAKVYIVGGDSEDATTTDGRYELDLKKGISANIGDEIEVYIYHKTYGLHKINVPVVKSLRYDFEIQIENVVPVQGSIIDAVTNLPVEAIEVALIPEEVEGALNDNPLAKSDRFGRFKFLLSKDILGSSKYARLIFLDTKNCYETKREIFDVRPDLEVKLKNTCALPPIKPSTKSSDNSVLVSNLNNELYGTVFFESGEGVSRYELMRSPNRNEQGRPIVSIGTKISSIKRSKEKS
jgi:hypothetical protein